MVASGIECSLQFDIQGTRADAAPIHRTKHLDFTDGIEAEPFGDPRFHQLDNARNCGLRVVRLHKVKVGLGSGRAEIGDRALVDAMGASDDAALRGLPKHLGEAHHWHRAG